MSVKLYMDVHVKRAVTDALRLRGVDVLTAREDDSAELEDDLLLRPCHRIKSCAFLSG